MQRMIHYCFVFALTCACCGANQLFTFDGASASNTRVGFEPRAAASGSGYWCSTGAHKEGSVVTWTGSLNIARNVLGIKIHWAYAPGEVQIMTSTDGGNYVVALPWRKNERNEASYEEMFMFDSPINVKSVTVSMRNPLQPGYFGIRDAAVIAAPGLVMLARKAERDLCVVSTSVHEAPRPLDVEPCLDAIYAGDGRELFQLSDDGSLVAVASQMCVTWGTGENSETALNVHHCDGLAADGDELAWAMEPDGKLVSLQSGLCLTSASEGLVMRDCDAPELFTIKPAPALSPNAANARYMARFFQASVSALEATISDLKTGLSALPSCAGIGALFNEGAAIHGEIGANVSKRVNVQTEKINNSELTSGAPNPAFEVEHKLGVNMQSLAQHMREAKDIIAMLRDKLHV